MLRVIFGAFFLIILVYVMENFKNFKKIYKNKRLMLALTLTSMLIGFNWGLYLWAINNNHVMETSLGYFTTPLILIFCGIVFLKEKLTKLKMIAVLLTICAVSYNIIAFHGFPWISITLAVSFAVYTVLRKKIPIDSLSGLLFETILLVPIAIIYLVYIEHHSL